MYSHSTLLYVVPQFFHLDHRRKDDSLSIIKKNTLPHTFGIPYKFTNVTSTVH